VTPVRRGLTVAGAPVRTLLITLIHIYRATLSGLLGGRCRFEPSCSAYAEQAIRTRGAVVGSLLATWRILRCNPFGRPGLDPVPERPPYDAVVRRSNEKARV
jgi:putative membrane protein insertion efficiency factor